ncbi:uncharacterized protein LOC112506642 isoform X3 [Cynara cardunculus var. scolymus]|uniref:uncharacterized protein LOC112506642 isoform X3 n=1 Tax=Cynara cardunculus var. scolymus TaxID=59895 RepID=UPI000D625329|nr:uncharacterized protein LOC112506642 isoform X3 [Cynara cardunculus var. scolymus]
MGSACCVAARDRTITDQSVSDVMPRNDRYSPSWSFRWDNRGRVAGEESSMNCFPDGAGVNDRLDNKSHTTVETAYATEQGSPLDSSRSLAWQKSPPSEENGVPQSDPSNSKNLPEGKESRRTPVASELCPTKILTPTHSVSSFSASPLSSSQGHLLPLTSLTPSRWPRRSPGHHLLRQVSDSRIRGIMSPNFSISEEGSPFMHPGWSSKSNRGSHGGSSDECLESMTPEIHKYDPACPICTFGEKKVLKLSEKALATDMDLKAKISKKLRNRVVDGDSVVFKSSVSRMSSSSSVKCSTGHGKPFLRRHFSFGSKWNRSLSDNSCRKKRFFWSKE